MEENPLDLEQHEEETLWDVWKRRLMFLLLIALCITFAAPTFGACEGALGTGGSEIFATYTVQGQQREVTRMEFQTTYNRLAYTLRLLGGQDPDDDDQVWAHILQNAAAVEAGIHIPVAQIARLISSVPLFQTTGGAFDDSQYRSQLMSLTGGALSPRSFQTTLRELARVSEYRSIYQSAYSLTPSREAYEQWKDRNTKLSVSYVVQPFQDLVAEVESENPDDATLSAFSRTPAAEAQLRVPAQKVVETAFLRVGEMSDVQLKELENLVTEQDVLDEDADVLGAQAYHEGQETIYTRANWLKAERKNYELALAAHELKVKEWEAGDQSEPKPELDVPDPAMTQVPEDFLERYEKLWRDRILKEVYAREFLAFFAERASREGRTLSDLAGEYEVLGVQVVKNEEPIADRSFRDEYPAGLADRSEMDTVVQQYLRGPAPGKTFVPEIHEQPVPTTMLGEDLDARGYMVLRLEAFEPSRIKTVEEARDEIIELWRSNQVRVRARERLEAIQAKVEGGESTLDEAAAAAGLEVFELERFNGSTPERRPPVAAPGEELDPEQQVLADRIRYRNRVVRDYGELERTDVGSFRQSVLLADSADAAFLIRLDETHEPTPQEMRPEDLRAARLRLLNQTFRQRVGLDDPQRLFERFQLEVDDEDEAAGDAADGDSDNGA